MLSAKLTVTFQCYSTYGLDKNNKIFFYKLSIFLHFQLVSKMTYD